MKQKFIALARLMSFKSPSDVKIGCVIAKGNKEISVGFNNMKKTHPKSPHPFRTLHAEFDAILGIDPRDLEGATIYVYRELKNGTPAIAKPCKFCETALKKVGVSVCFYSDYEGFKRMDL